MIEMLVLAAQLAGASPSPMPPQDWSGLRPLPLTRESDDGANLSAFVRAEVKAGRCTAAVAMQQGWMLKIDLAVLVGPGAQPRRVVPRAIACPSVEQYAAGLISSMARGNIAVSAAEPDTWYRTSLTFSWPA
ncbi:hypothetical protein FHT00_001645 [Sphingomonas insulae]|uniref:Uncharacterized protein n=1 Tax=Sphingomonas insulae TaxID=424800 RepID=A0ABN1HY77_9SPHN|nr:hypothetical protein [Sphingomonas insulae]NIJ29698.1 hypothetical protein [Sphingomonas insulae]